MNCPDPWDPKLGLEAFRVRPRLPQPNGRSEVGATGQEHIDSPGPQTRAWAAGAWLRTSWLSEDCAVCCGSWERMGTPVGCKAVGQRLNNARGWMSRRGTPYSHHPWACGEEGTSEGGRQDPRAHPDQKGGHPKVTGTD